MLVPFNYDSLLNQSSDSKHKMPSEDTLQCLRSQVDKLYMNQKLADKFKFNFLLIILKRNH